MAIPHSDSEIDPQYHYQIDDLSLNTQLGTVYRGDTEIPLPQLSYTMFCYLVSQAPAIISQDDLMNVVWGDQVVGDETLKQRIKLLRQALSDTPQAPKYIASVRGRGYRCIANIEKSPLNPNAINQAIHQPINQAIHQASHQASHDGINLRLADRLPVSMLYGNSHYWRLVAIFLLMIITILSTVISIHVLSRPKPLLNGNTTTSNTAKNINNKDSDSPHQAQLAYEKGHSFYLRYQALDNAMAIKSFLKAIELEPNHALAYAGLADAYSQGVFQFSADDSWQQKALAAAYDAIMLDDQLPQSYKALGTAHYINGHIAQALSANLKAVTLAPQQIDAQANLGYMYSERGQLNQALERHQQVYQLDPNYQLNWYHLALTLQRMGHLNTAKGWYQKFIASRPDYHLATYHYSRLLVQHNQLDTALQRLQHAEQKAPDNPNVLKGLVDFYLLSGQIERAKVWTHKLKLLSGGENQQYAGLLDLLSSDPIDRLALRNWYDKHLKDYNERSFNHVQLAMAASQLQLPDAAFRHLTEAVELGWRDAQYLSQIGFMKPLQSHEKFQRILKLIERQQHHSQAQPLPDFVVKQ